MRNTLRIVSMKLKAKSDRKSTRLNSSHVRISYAVFCLNKKFTLASCDQHRDIHSFPTRRSSDLAEAEQAKIDAKYQALIAEADALFEGNKLDKAKSKYEAALAVKNEEYPQNRINEIESKVRSEEHTSELQSRPHIVCCLLLEQEIYTSIMRPTSRYTLFPYTTLFRSS